MATKPTVTSWVTGKPLSAAAYNASASTKWGVPSFVSPVTGKVVNAAAYNAAVSTTWNTSMAAYGQMAKDHPEIFGGSATSAPSTKGPQLTYNSKELVYNVGCVRDAYFRNSDGFFTEITTSKTGTVTDRPTKTITDVNQLWQNSGSNKGMVILFVPQKTDAAVDGAIVPDSTQSDLQPAEHNRYGFQFHYNPTTIDMNYAGAPNTDVGMEVSGQEKFNLVGSQVNQSTITFDIIVNRVFDFNYYDETGRLKPEAKQTNNPVYFPRMPKNAEEEKLIFNKGTMYDIEFLLSTVIGYRLKTKLRGTTADVGWLSGRPVELHLGKSLRYVGFINAFTIKHQMFNERMVPIFTTASLSFNRIPDYSGM